MKKKNRSNIILDGVIKNHHINQEFSKYEHGIELNSQQAWTFSNYEICSKHFDLIESVS